MRWSKNKREIMKYLEKHSSQPSMKNKYAILFYAIDVQLDHKTLSLYLNELVRNGYLIKKEIWDGSIIYDITQKWIDEEKEILKKR